MFFIINNRPVFSGPVHDPVFKADDPFTSVQRYQTGPMAPPSNVVGVSRTIYDSLRLSVFTGGVALAWLEVQSYTS